MSRRRGRRGRRPSGFTGPGLRELYNVVLPFGGADKRRFFNQISDRIVVMLGVAAAVVGYGAGGRARGGDRAGPRAGRGRPRDGPGAIPPRMRRALVDKNR